MIIRNRSEYMFKKISQIFGTIKDGNDLDDDYDEEDEKMRIMMMKWSRI